MGNTPEVVVRSTGPMTADVWPEVILRDGIRTRMVFKPVLLNNNTDKSAAVKGTITYQTKRISDEWEDVQSIPLNRVKSGENLRFELNSAEMLKFYQCLDALYEYMKSSGFPCGTKRLVVVDEAPAVRDFLDTLSKFDSPKTAECILKWLVDRDIHATADLLRGADSELVGQLSVAAGLAKITKFVAEAKSMISSGDEKAWQQLIARNSWTLGHIYASPMVILQKEAYLGGKRVDNKGGNVADFLYKNNLTDNALIVEIKTPVTPLTGKATYRNNGYACSPELAGAVQQVLQDRYTIQAEYDSMHRDKTPDFRIFSPRLLLIVGNIGREGDSDKVRSFELFRNGLTGIDVVTFDEIIDKAEQMLRLFTES